MKRELLSLGLLAVISTSAAVELRVALPCTHERIDDETIRVRCEAACVAESRVLKAWPVSFVQPYAIELEDGRSQQWALSVLHKTYREAKGVCDSIVDGQAP